MTDNTNNKRLSSGGALAEDGSLASALNGKKKWDKPRILSIEPLEAAAATCSPPSGGFGKTAPPCSPVMTGS